MQRILTSLPFSKPVEYQSQDFKERVKNNLRQINRDEFSSLTELLPKKHDEQNKTDLYFKIAEPIVLETVGYNTTAAKVKAGSELFSIISDRIQYIETQLKLMPEVTTSTKSGSSVLFRPQLNAAQQALQGIPSGITTLFIDTNTKNVTLNSEKLDKIEYAISHIEDLDQEDATSLLNKLFYMINGLKITEKKYFYDHTFKTKMIELKNFLNLCVENLSSKSNMNVKFRGDIQGLKNSLKEIDSIENFQI